jgi:hypothetical protein
MDKGRQVSYLFRISKEAEGEDGWFWLRNRLTGSHDKKSPRRDYFAHRPEAGIHQIWTHLQVLRRSPKDIYPACGYKIRNGFRPGGESHVCKPARTATLRFIRSHVDRGGFPGCTHAVQTYR